MRISTESLGEPRTQRETTDTERRTYFCRNTMWPDHVSQTDYLNFFEVSDLISDLVSNPNLRPISIGVFGGWGSGKSTLIQLSREKLATDDSYVIVDFDAWLYQNFDDARSALLESVGTRLMEASKKDQGTLKKAVSLLKRVNKLRMLGLIAEGGALMAGTPTFGVLGKGIESASSIVSGQGDADDFTNAKKSAGQVSDIVKAIATPEETRTPPQEITAFREEFSSLLKDLNKTLVVYVDNLDRCLPRNAILTLEAIRLVLFMPNTAFIIAADEDMVRLAVSDHYKTSQNRLINDYLDKLIQVPIYVPRLGVAEVTSYLFLLFSSAFKWSDHQRDVVTEILQKSLQGLWEKPLVTAGEIIDAIEIQGDAATELRFEIENAYGLASRLAPLLAKSRRVAGNPRIIKRLLNTIWMRASISKKRNMPTIIDKALIAKIVIFERCMSNAATTEFYRLINDSDHGKPQLISKLEAKDKITIDDLPETWEDVEFVISWINLKPKLGSVDLRAVAYLARETLPIRLSVDGLSAAAETAVNALLKIKNLSSPAIKTAFKNLPREDYPAVMEAIIDHLRKTTSWGTKPDGFSGAISLARKSDEAAKNLRAFISSLGKIPPWMNVQIKSEDWWKAGN